MIHLNFYVNLLQQCTESETIMAETIRSYAVHKPECVGSTCSCGLGTLLARGEAQLRVISATLQDFKSVVHATKAKAVAVRKRSTN